MKIIKLKPVTNGSRHCQKIEKYLLSRNNKLSKGSIKRIFYSYGRSTSTGRITSWHKGGGNKNLFRSINFLNKDSNSIVISTMYDPCRSSFITLNFDLDKKIFFRTLSIDSIYPGSLVSCKSNLSDLKLGYRTQIKNIPVGSLINSISLNDKKCSQYIRSAGTYGQIIQSSFKKAKIRLPSNKIIEVDLCSFATIGIISNLQHNLVVLGKAGKSRHLGKRPVVRGIAMNPVDHPHGGRTNGGRPSVTPWGLPTKGGFYLKKRKKNYE
jgi:large subunit ribosomal protein L2